MATKFADIAKGPKGTCYLFLLGFDVIAVVTSIHCETFRLAVMSYFVIPLELVKGIFFISGELVA